jgi:hypothetical protein
MKIRNETLTPLIHRAGVEFYRALASQLSPTLVMKFVKKMFEKLIVPWINKENLSSQLSSKEEITEARTANNDDDDVVVVSDNEERPTKRVKKMSAYFSTMKRFDPQTFLFRDKSSVTNEIICLYCVCLDVQLNSIEEAATALEIISEMLNVTDFTSTAENSTLLHVPNTSLNFLYCNQMIFLNFIVMFSFCRIFQRSLQTTTYNVSI